MNYNRIITFLLAWTMALAASASNYFFRKVDVKDGLSDNFVRDVVRDSHGYVWFSTINGLSRFDGYRFHNYMPQHFGARGNDVTMVRETADSTLWMSCAGELFTYNRLADTWRKDGVKRLEKLGVEGRVELFYVDDRHNLWAATDMGLFHYDFSLRKIHRLSNFSGAPISSIVSRNGTTIVVNSDNKIYEVSLKSDRLIHLSQASFLVHDRNSRVFLDSHMTLWFFNSHTLVGTQWLFSLKTHEWRQPTELAQMGPVLLNALLEDNDGRLWMGTGNAGIHVFDYPEGNLEIREVMAMRAFTPHSSHISCLYLDANNTMWVGSAKLGVAFTDMSSPNFTHVSTDDKEDVSSLLQDDKGNLWVGFDGAGIMMKSPDGATTHFTVSSRQLPSDIITSLALLPNGDLLAGTYGNGVARLQNGVFETILSQHDCLRYVKAMATDNSGNLWVATVDKGVVRVMADGNIVNYTTENSLLVSNGILCLAFDTSQNLLYIGTSMGVSAYDCSANHFVNIEPLEKLNGTYVMSMIVCNKSILFIGSRDGLWTYRRKEAVINHFTTDDGLSNNTIRALARSGDHVWAATDNGLTCIISQNTDSQHFAYKCIPFFSSDGLEDIIFSNNAAATMRDGRALLGCYTGYVGILPENIMPQHPRLTVQFTDFVVNGEQPTNDERKGNIRPSDNIVTIHHDDHLSIALSAMLPAQSRKIKYFYRFKGEGEWMGVPANMLHLGALTSGKHVLQVKAELPGMMESDIAQLIVKVKPPFWLSVPAIMIYVLLLLIAFYLFNRLMRQKQKRQLAVKQMEVNLKKYEMEEEKIRFFTNISHDLKTPLALVMAPIEKLRALNLPAPIRTEMDVVWRNAHQLYDLILELLDFRRLDVGMEKLNLKHGDIVSFVRQTAQGFAYYAAFKEIRMFLKLPPTALEIDFDENKLRRIVTNLLSNAYKYNTDKGSVTVELKVKGEEKPQQIVLSIADTGIGVKDKRHVFDRFMQESHGHEQEGSGLGLHIVKQYVDMMGGSIDVTDNTPKGTVFTVTLPINSDSEANLVEQVVLETEENDEENVGKEKKDEKPTILVVEDNTDARQFLQRSLEGEYHILVAANGKEALRIIAKNNDVSIVVSDIMMPVMDGITLFRQLKSNINYSHIPVVLLTAKSGEEDIVESLKEGVADYITKPFSLEVLKLRIRKILEWTHDAHQKVGAGIEIKPSEITVSSLDEELISHVMESIEANMQESDYSVSQLSSDVGMTRGHLYKKLMAITGKSPLEFIRIVKMKRGKSLLDQGKTNISEVADMVGLSPKQFTNYFKQTYGEIPSEYLKRNK